MKMILLEDVKNVGKKGQLINASDGYAKNFLLPKKLAVEATKSNINDLELKKKAEDKRKAQELAEAKTMAEDLEKKNIKISVKSGDNGKLFGSVTNKEIAAALEEQTGIKIDKKKIVLDEPLKTTGEKKVPVKLHASVTAQMTVTLIEA